MKTEFFYDSRGMSGLVVLFGTTIAVHSFDGLCVDILTATVLGNDSDGHERLVASHFQKSAGGELLTKRIENANSEHSIYRQFIKHLVNEQVAKEVEKILAKHFDLEKRWPFPEDTE